MMDLTYIYNYFKKMESKDRDEIIDILPIKEIYVFFKNNKKYFPINLINGFRMGAIPKFKIKAIFNKAIEENKYKKFIFCIYELLQNELKIIEEKISIVNRNNIKLTSSNLSKNNELLEEIVIIISKSNFNDNVKLFFVVKEIKLTLKLEKEINLIIDNQKMYYKIYNKLQEEFELELKKTLDLKISEKDKIINEKQNIIRDLNFQKNDFKSKMDQDNIKFNNKYKGLNNNIEDLRKNVNDQNFELNKKNDEIEDLKKELKKRDVLIEALNKEKNELKRNIELEKSRLRIIVEAELEEEGNSLLELVDETSKFYQNEKIKLENLKKEYEEYETNYKWLKERFSDDISKLKSFFKENEIKNEEGQKVEDKSMLIGEQEIALDEYDECCEIEDFEMVLMENLEYSGIESKYKVNLAKYLTAILSNEKNILLIGHNSREIAHSIAATTFNENAQIISCVENGNIFNELFNIIRKSDKNVILIENLVENVSESIYLPIIKNIDDKILIFSMENSDNIHLLNRSIFNYLIPIDLEFVGNLSINNKLTPSIFDFKNFNNNEIVNDKKDKINKFIGHKAINNILDSILSDLIVSMSKLFEISEEIAYATATQYTMYPILKNKGKEKLIIDIYENKPNELSKLDEFVKYLKEENEWDE